MTTMSWSEEERSGRRAQDRFIATAVVCRCKQRLNPTNEQKLVNKEDGKKAGGLHGPCHEK